MYLHFEEASVYMNGKFEKKNDFLFYIGEGVSCASSGLYGGIRALDLKNGNYAVIPGFADVHVHLREPGFSYKETIASGTKAAARGGYTTVCPMPNLNPAPHCPERLQEQLSLIERDAVISVVPYATITKEQKGEELSEMAALAAMEKNNKKAKIAGFSDDGHGVQNGSLMKQAMVEAKKHGKMIVAHCEDNTFPSEDSASEWRQIERDLALVRETGCAYHICHVSAKESVALIRQAKQEGLDVSCETAPHYLVLDSSMTEDDGCFKMNPPIREKADREALLAAVKDGTIDMIATDHAPHSVQEKEKGFADSLMGIVGLETAFPVLYTELVLTGVLSLEQLIRLLSENPRRRFGLEHSGYSIWELDEEYEIDPAAFLSMGKSTPFSGRRVQGRCIATVFDGRTVWADEEFMESHRGSNTGINEADAKRMQKQAEMMLRTRPGGMGGPYSR